MSAGDYRTVEYSGGAEAPETGACGAAHRNFLPWKKLGFLGLEEEIRGFKRSRSSKEKKKENIQEEEGLSGYLFPVSGFVSFREFNSVLGRFHV